MSWNGTRGQKGSRQNVQPLHQGESDCLRVLKCFSKVSVAPCCAQVCGVTMAPHFPGLKTWCLVIVECMCGWEGKRYQIYLWCGASEGRYQMRNADSREGMLTHRAGREERSSSSGRRWGGGQCLLKSFFQWHCRTEQCNNLFTSTNVAVKKEAAQKNTWEWSSTERGKYSPEDWISSLFKSVFKGYSIYIP